MCLALGISYHDFWGMNPRIVKIFNKAQAEKEKIYDTYMWAMGAYVYEAVYVSIGKFFGGEGFTLNYPDAPRTTPQEDAEAVRMDRELKKALAIEESWVVRGKQMGLPKVGELINE